MNFPPGARNHGDGRVFFPMRGPPPGNPPPGWSEDPDDPYTWIMDYQPCVYRTPLKMIKCPMSGQSRPHDFCEELKKKVNPLVCSTCTVRKENV